MNILLSNYGNDSIALIQWAFLNGLNDVTVVSWDTGWQEESWALRIQDGLNFVQRCAFSHHILKARVGFRELVEERQAFPTPKFQWCATLLKGVPLLQWLNQIDREMQATLIVPARREALHAYANLPERLEESEHYGGRAVWHPLLQTTLAARDALILAAGFTVLPHRSLECDPCVHSGRNDFKRLSASSCSKTAQLETKIGQVMFPAPALTKDSIAMDITSVVARAQRETTHDDSTLITTHSGCGAPYGCGI